MVTTFAYLAIWMASCLSANQTNLYASHSQLCVYSSGHFILKIKLGYQCLRPVGTLLSLPWNECNGLPVCACIVPQSFVFVSGASRVKHCSGVKGHVTALEWNILELGRNAPNLY